MKTYKIQVIVNVNEDIDMNDAIGGLCDIIRDGLNNKQYDYIADIQVKQER